MEIQPFSLLAHLIVSRIPLNPSLSLVHIYEAKTKSKCNRSLCYPYSPWPTLFSELCMLFLYFLYLKFKSGWFLKVTLTPSNILIVRLVSHSEVSLNLTSTKKHPFICPPPHLQVTAVARSGVSAFFYSSAPSVKLPRHEASWKSVSHGTYM